MQLRWRHVIINTKSSWLHGDARGFRDRDHRIHSSGDYKHRPPEGEHAHLHEYMKSIASPEMRIDFELRGFVGHAFVHHLQMNHVQIDALAVGKVHAHALVNLPDDLRAIRAIVGDAKRVSSRAIRRWVPGSIWSAGGTFKPVDDDRHFACAERYILYDQGIDAWTWWMRDEMCEGVFGRQRSRGAMR